MAVYTEVTDEALRHFLASYALGELVAFRGIAEGVENSNYALKTEAGDFILTLYEKRVDPAELPYFLGLMDHMAARGLACPVPVKGADGEALRSLADRPAAICTFLPGVWPRRVRPEHCGPLGTALAAMHDAAGDFSGSRANTLGPSGWLPLLNRCRGGAMPAEGVFEELSTALHQVLEDWPRVLPVGQIHADLFPDNVFFLNDGKTPRVSGIIDFYFACTDLLAYDIAVCLNAWCFEADFAFNVTKARALLAGYRARRVLSQAEIEALPVLCRGAAIRFALTRLFDWANTPEGAMVTRKDPMDYVRRLRFHAAARGPDAYGL
ncbi:homoserine kinase [Plastoroseomonas arctica]|uniref:Homoserine kinase n=1 Tax=Plastoroseomonas arctica TaxID=1509237 RepID=A0AAF1K031_9PROT|nr:homoserine kinase [Plastoroseomonas arctica]MBR0657415.1 homoserine kinase [Plastoroseomonas arctica]